MVVGGKRRLQRLSDLDSVAFSFLKVIFGADLINFIYTYILGYWESSVLFETYSLALEDVSFIS